LLAVGIICGLLLLAIPYRLRYTVPMGWLVDMGIMALFAGVLLARVFHVWLNWRYFAEHTAEITQLSAGGYNWHGAVIGVLCVVFLVSHHRHLNVSFLLDHLAIALPLLAFSGWWGCGAATCSYGAEVERMADYPGWATWDGAGEFGLIAPRFATQSIGMMLSGVLLGVIIVITRKQWLEESRFWFILVLFALGMFAIDGLRGDYAPIYGVPKFASLRADQWLDLVFAVGSILVFFLVHRRAIANDNQFPK